MSFANQVFKHRIYLKDGEISHYLERDLFETEDQMNTTAAHINNGYDSFQDKDYTATVHPPIWKLDESGNAVDVTDEEYEKILDDLDLL